MRKPVVYRCVLVVGKSPACCPAYVVRALQALPPRAPAPAALFAPRAFALSPEEANVVQLLRDVVRQQRLAVVPRICGGWCACEERRRVGGVCVCRGSLTLGLL